MLPLIHSPATAPKNTLEFSSAKDIIERERSKKQANGGSSETPENVHKTKSVSKEYSRLNFLGTDSDSIHATLTLFF